MNYVMSGASGFVGSHFIDHVARAECDVIAISRKSNESPQKIRWVVRDTLLGMKISLPANTTFLHLEVKQHISNPSEDEVEEFHTVNVIGTRNWLEWCSKNNVETFIYLSSIKAIRSGPQIVTEESSEPGDSFYGQSKWEAELEVRKWAQEKKSRRAVILRPAVLYGPRITHNFYSFIDAIARRKFFFVGRNENIKSIVSIRNLCAAIHHAAHQTKENFLVYNLTDPKSFSVREIANMLALMFDVRPPSTLPVFVGRFLAKCGSIAEATLKMRMPLTLARLNALTEESNFSCKKIMNAGFIHPQNTWEGFAELVEWYRITQK